MNTLTNRFIPVLIIFCACFIAYWEHREKEGTLTTLAKAEAQIRDYAAMECVKEAKATYSGSGIPVWSRIYTTGDNSAVTGSGNTINGKFIPLSEIDGRPYSVGTATTYQWTPDMMTSTMSREEYGKLLDKCAKADDFEPCKQVLLREIDKAKAELFTRQPVPRAAITNKELREIVEVKK